MKLNSCLKRVFAATVCTAILLSSGCANTNTSSTTESVASTEETTGNIGEVKLNDGDTVAIFEIEGYGTIKAKLFPDIAPIGVKNFVDLCASGYYDGKTIHRVIADFMLQGGSFNGDGTGGTAADGTKFSTEINDNARHFYGALCYANAGADNNTCQFYIVNSKKSVDVEELAKNYAYQVALYYSQLSQEMIDAYKAIENKLMCEKQSAKDKYLEVGGAPSLDNDYTVFGQVVEGFDVIDAISACEVEAQTAMNEASKPVNDIIITSVKTEIYTSGN